MKKSFEVLALSVTVVALVIAVLAWLAPFSPIGPSPFSPKSTEKTNVVTPAPPRPTSQPTDSNVVLNEDFESGIANHFVFGDGKWQVVDDGTGNRVLEARNLGSSLSLWPCVIFGPSKLGDFNIEYRVKLIDYDTWRATGSGMVTLNIRRDSSGNQYAISLIPFDKLIYAGFAAPDAKWVAIGGQNRFKYEFQKNVWYSVRVETKGEKISGYLNGELVISAEDSRLKQGELQLCTGPDTIAQFDNVRVWK